MAFCTQTLLTQLMPQAEGGSLNGVLQMDFIAFYHSPCPAELSQSFPECSPSSASPVQFPAQAGSPPLGQSGGHTVCCGAWSWWTPCVEFTEGEALRAPFHRQGAAGPGRSKRAMHALLPPHASEVNKPLGSRVLPGPWSMG